VILTFWSCLFLDEPRRHPSAVPTPTCCCLLGWVHAEEYCCFPGHIGRLKDAWFSTCPLRFPTSSLGGGNRFGLVRVAVSGCLK
jgi:hypothetical protein